MGSILDSIMKKTSHWFYIRHPISGYAGHGARIVKVVADTYENALLALWKQVQENIRGSLQDFQNQMFEEFHTYHDDYGFEVIAVHDNDVIAVIL